MAKNHKILILLLLVLAGAGFFIWQIRANSNGLNDKSAGQNSEPESPFLIQKIEITDGSTYGQLMTQAAINAATSTAIFNAAQEIYDLSKIRAGRTLDLVYEKKTGALHQLIYQIDTEKELFVTQNDEGWQAEIIPIPYKIKIVTEGGQIESSMYAAALAAGIDERAIIDLANVFQWSVDFAMDVRQGDTFKFIYEKRYREGAYVMPGRIFAGAYHNAGKNHYAFYFEESEDNKGYFDENGNSVQKLFLRAPLEYKYISSGFTTGLRYIQAFNISTGHRAIDYAAAAGTPVRSVGDGTITYAGWNGAYGNFITIRHNATYSTNYAHLSRFAVRRGQRVTQGQIIGYVGSTGLSTGPHLHYEMVKHGVKINPLTEVLPPGQAIKEENKPEFFRQIKDWAEELGLNIETN